MIGTISIKCNAAHPEMALPTMFSFINSPSSIRIRDVPKKIGKWKITSVRVTAIYPDKTAKSAQCVLVGGAWVGTIEGSPASGTCTNGYTVLADGIDENGNPVENYVLGRGDVKILKEDGTPIEDPTHFVTDEELDAAISSKAEISSVEEVTEDIANLANSLSGYYAKTETSSNVELDAKFETKADLSALNEVESSLSDYYTKSETSSAAELQTAFNNVSVDLSEYYTKSETSSATEISTALALKQDKLTNAQLSAIGSVVDELMTYFTFPDGSVETVFVAGELNTPYLQYLNPVLTPEKMRTVVQAKLGTAVTKIVQDAFNGCTALTKIDIPSSVVEIGSAAFGSCYALERIEIPDGVTTVDNLFNYTDVHADVVFGTGVQSISQGMFHYVTPASVTFKGKTLAEVQAMADYPWDIEDTSIIKTWNIATQEWVLELLSAFEARMAASENN